MLNNYRENLARFINKLKGLVVRQLFKTFLIILTFATFSCTTLLKTENSSAPNQTAYIPAKISVLPCILWPGKVLGTERFAISQDQLQSLCSTFDNFVIEGFKDQPFMKGYTPKAVFKLLESNNQSQINEQMINAWIEAEKNCKKCGTGKDFYSDILSKKDNWIQILNQFSKSTKFSDAILIPLILQANQEKRNERGLLISENSSQIILLLIDSNNGNLIWSHQRFTQTNNKTLKEGEQSYPPFPEWDTLFAKLFVDSIWSGFPGRQSF